MCRKDFDEKRFDLDEYEQRLQRFEEYLARRKGEDQTTLEKSRSDIIPNIDQSEESKECSKSHEVVERDSFGEVAEIFKAYCDKFRPLDSKPKEHVSDHLRSCGGSFS